MHRVRRALPAAGFALVVTGSPMVAAARYREQLRPLQRVETGIVPALTAAATAAVFLILRRRHA
ncbi:hypothetical protein OG735_19785 [Streptomyces sp. NBC_01210]|uniref:hypothetical protein n=1 Tax=Streptomyces sp. NBC_01210 TaxID=2903774 RepID=UPI002E131A5E|nr:hypothetical protein OG735_19785 [Streptomyces sp. NBC_01210]